MRLLLYVLEAIIKPYVQMCERRTSQRALAGRQLDLSEGAFACSVSVGGCGCRSQLEVVAVGAVKHSAGSEGVAFDLELSEIQPSKLRKFSPG